MCTITYTGILIPSIQVLGRLVIVRVLTRQDKLLTRSWGGLPETSGISAYKVPVVTYFKGCPFRWFALGDPHPDSPR